MEWLGERWERWYPALGGLIAATTYFFAFRDVPLPKASKEILGGVVNVSAIAVGFLATAQSIIVSLGGKRMVRMLRQSGHLSALGSYLTHAIASAFMLAVLSVAMLVLDLDQPSNLNPLAISSIVAVWVMTATASVLACFRVLRLLADILPAED